MHRYPLYTRSSARDNSQHVRKEGFRIQGNLSRGRASASGAGVLADPSARGTYGRYADPSEREVWRQAPGTDEEGRTNAETEGGMRIMFRIRLAALVVVSVAIAAFAQAQTTQASQPAGTQPAASQPALYEIKFFRPEKVGDKSAFSCSGSTKKVQTMIVEGKAEDPKTQDLVYELSGASEVATIDDKERVTERTFTIEKCIRIDGEKRIEVAGKSTVVNLRCIDGVKAIKPRDPTKKLSPEAIQILSQAIALLANKDFSNDDDAIGTKERKKIGESWTVNKGLFAKSFFERSGMIVKDEDIKGEVKLLGIKTVSGIECLEIGLDVSVLKLALPNPVRNGVKREVEKATIAVNLMVLLPLNGKDPLLGGKESMIVVCKGKATGPGGVAETEFKQEDIKTVLAIPTK